MAENGGLKTTRQPGRLIGGWLYGVVTKTGWSRWVALAVAAFLFMLSGLYFLQRTDYREDPSALVPRSADLYAETRDLPLLLKTADGWKLWREDRRRTGAPEGGGALARELAASVSAHAGGLPVNPPLRWMEASLGAAWSVSRDESGAESWALYLKLENPEEALREIAIEPGMTLETTLGERPGDCVLSLSGPGGKTAFAGVVGPWLILSGDAKLPEFALEAKRRPAVSLAGSGMLPDWRRAAGLRGLFNPAYTAERGLAAGPSIAGEWLSPKARVAYTAQFGANGGVEANFRTAELSDRAPGAGRLWPLVFLVMAVIGLGSLCVILCILLMMLGWGAWLKALALRAGVTAAAEPENVEPSQAFTEDSGAGETETELENDIK